MKRARSTEGFTVIELAIVVLLMGSMAMLIVPGLSEWVSDSRASAAAEDVLRLNRGLRARVNETGLAHLLVYRASDDSDGSNALGKVQVWEGMNNRCNQTPWMQTIQGKIEDGHYMIDSVDLGNSAYNLPMNGNPPTAADNGRQVIRLLNSTSDPKSVVLCFEPGGNTLTAVTEGDSDIGFRFTPQTEPIVFTVRRTVSHAGGTPIRRGVDRQVVYPVGGGGRLSL